MDFMHFLVVVSRFKVALVSIEARGIRQCIYVTLYDQRPKYLAIPH